MAFENDEEQEQQLIKPKNISSQKSIFDKKAKTSNSKLDFSNSVKKAEENHTNNSLKFVELDKKYISILADKTLKENKNILVREMERDLLKEMVLLADDVNSDENEKESQGNLGLLSILLKANVLQRNYINNLEFNFAELQKRLSSVEARLAASQEEMKKLSKS